MSQNPFDDSKWFIDPASNAQKQILAWQVTRPDAAAKMQKIASHAQADWFGDWNADIKAAVNTRVAQIDSAGKLPVLVAYNIPQRDCHGRSAGGATAAHAYRQWVKDFAAGIGNRKAVVILEPDALAHAGPHQPCSALQAERFALLHDATTTLKANPNTFVYVDAGNAHWIDAAVIATLLASAGINLADGFALNVANFVTKTPSLLYGKTISQLLGNKPFIIDSSRNGHGEATPGVFCNPPDKGLGVAPTTNTGNALCHAFVWIKRPGESDGTCNGGPDAGKWWSEYALGLCKHSVF